MASSLPTSGPRPWILGLVIFVLGAVAFVPALDGDFLVDDRPLIADNAVVQGPPGSWFFAHLWDTTRPASSLAQRTARYWRPLVQATYVADWRLGGGSPLVFHATNLWLHALVSWLVWRTLSRWFGDTSSGWVFFGALLWAVHPTKGENVAWISGRPDLLLGLGVFVALYGTAARLRGSQLGLSIELLGTLCAFTAKESAVVLPCFVAAEWWFASQRGELAPSRRSCLVTLSPSLAVGVGYWIWRTIWLPVLDGPVHVGWRARLLLPLESLARYVELLFWPSDLSLFRSIGTAPGQPFAVSAGYALGGALVVLGAIVCWRGRRLVPFVWPGVALFLVGLLPVLNFQILPTLVLAPARFLYLPSFGVVVAGIGALRAVSGTRQHPAWAPVLALSALSACGVLTWRRSADFASEESFWRYELAHNPRAPGRSFFVERELEQGRPRSALRIVAQALRDPSPDEIRFGRSDALVASGLEALLVLTPDSAPGDLAALARFSEDVRRGRPSVLDLAARNVRWQLGRIPAKPHRFLVIEAEAYSRLGRDAEALAVLREFRSTCVGCEGIQEPLFFVAARAGELELAAELLREMKRLGPTARARLWEKHREGRVITAQPGWREIPPLAARYWSVFRAWGRAYRALPPSDQLEALDPATRDILGELAARAGDEPGALRLWSGLHGSAESGVRLTKIQLEMGWRDTKVGSAEALPESLR